MVFVLVTGNLLVSENTISASNPWTGATIAVGQETEQSKSAHTLEFTLPSPTPLHGFVSLPIA